MIDEHRVMVNPVLIGSGAAFIEPPTAYDGLRIATLTDPEGNLIQLFQPTG